MPSVTSSLEAKRGSPDHRGLGTVSWKANAAGAPLPLWYRSLPVLPKNNERHQKTPNNNN
jgi:hypothetical protein